MGFYQRSLFLSIFKGGDFVHGVEAKNLFISKINGRAKESIKK